jgi:hypothetical protein
VDPLELKGGDPCWFRKSSTAWLDGDWERATIKGVHGVFSKHPSYVVIVNGEEHHGNRYNTKPLDLITRLGDVHEEGNQAAEIQQGAEGPMLGG